MEANFEFIQQHLSFLYKSADLNSNSIPKISSFSFFNSFQFSSNLLKMFEKFTRPTVKKEGKHNVSLKYHQINTLSEYFEGKKAQKLQQRFADKIIIITGSSSGIGRAAAMEFGKEGAKLVIHGQNEERLKETEKMLKNAGIGEERVLSIMGQMEREETAERIVEEALKKFGGIDVLINNAGAICKPGFWDPSKGNSLENLDYIYQANFRSAVQLTQMAMPHLEKSNGNVIMVSSILAIRPSPDAPFYGALKAAMDHYMRSVAQQFGPKGVRINCINPGVVDTNFFGRNGMSLEKANDWLKNVTVLKRPGQAEEIAACLKFLASDEAAYICGSTLVADGGFGVTVPEFQL